VRGIQRQPCHSLHPILPVSPVLTRPERHTDFLGRACLLLVLIVVCASVADVSPVALDRDGSTVVLEAYAPNIILVAMSLNKDGAPCSAWLWFCGLARGRWLDASAKRKRRCLPLLPPDRHGWSEPPRQADGDRG
jgi:hypothetical protein